MIQKLSHIIKLLKVTHYMYLDHRQPMVRYEKLVKLI